MNEEYDEKGNIVYCKNKYGGERWSEFNNKNQEIYRKTNYFGCILLEDWYEYHKNGIRFACLTVDNNTKLNRLFYYDELDRITHCIDFISKQEEFIDYTGLTKEIKSLWNKKGIEIWQNKDYYHAKNKEWITYLDKKTDDIIDIFPDELKKKFKIPTTW